MKQIIITLLFLAGSAFAAPAEIGLEERQMGCVQSFGKSNSLLLLTPRERRS